MRQQLEVTNHGDEPLEFAVVAMDADTGPIGGASYRRLEQPVEATGAWVSVERDEVDLDPGESDTVAFTVTVPEGADSGEHLAGIAVWAPEDVDERQDASGAVVAVEQRRVVAVQVTLPGAADPALDIRGVEPQAHADGVRLLVRIANEGRGLTSGEGGLEVVEPAFHESFEFGTFVPRTAIAYPLPSVDEPPAEGTYQARVELEYGTWTEWEGTFTIGDAITREIERHAPDNGGGAPSPTWLIPAIISLAAVLVLAAAAWGLYRLVQRHRQRRPCRPDPRDHDLSLPDPPTQEPTRGG